jgi:heat shock protein HspQ
MSRGGRALAAARTGAYIGAMTQPDKIPLDPTAPPQAPPVAIAHFTIGEVVRHRLFDFRGVIFDVDPVFANSEEWYQAIPEEIRPAKDQPFYHLLAENAESSYIAYVSQQNLLADTEGEPVDHPAISGMFEEFAKGRYQLRRERRH